MAQLFKNNAFSALAGSATDVATTLTLTPSTGSRFPSPTGGDFFLATLVGLDGNGSESSWEIVKVTGRSNDSLTVVRGQEGTTAVAWDAGARIESRATANTYAGLLPLAGGTLTGGLAGTTATFSTSVTTALHAMSGASPVIRAATSDGSDNAVMVITGGGDVSVDRGALVGLYGNEHATNPGDAVIYAGGIGKLAFKGQGGSSIGQQAAGAINWDFANSAANTASNAVRVRLMPAIGFINAPSVSPYIEGLVENGTTLATSLRFGTYNGSGLSEAMKIAPTGESVFNAAVQEKKTAVAASAIDLALGNFFTKTISGATTFTVSNVPPTGTAGSFVLELTDGGSAAVTWWSGVKWASGMAPTLTPSGVDVLGFYTHDGGTTWRGLLLAKDSK